MNQFSFVNSYSVLEKDENPLVTGMLKEEFDMDGRATAELDNAEQLYDKQRRKGHALHIDLVDLVSAKRSFEEEVTDLDEISESPSAELTLPQFVEAFGRLVGPENHEQLGYLFMKIDCNCDGRVNWDELLTFVMSQDSNEHKKTEVHDAHLVRAELPDCPTDEAHRESASHIVYVPKCSAYVSGGRDGTLRVWTAQLKLEKRIPIAENNKVVTVNGMALLTGTLGKLAVISSDRMLTLYELQDHAGSKRWSPYGKVALDDMPICVLAFQHVADEAPCLAVGSDAGDIRIFDAKQLISCFKDDELRAQMARGAIPFRYIVDVAIIITLPLHSDWVCSLRYEESLAALVSGSMDSTLRVTQLDWPPTAVPSSKAAHDASDALLRADPAHCRNISVIRAHSKGVVCFELMQITSRKLCATCSHERDAYVWNLETGDLLKTLTGHRALLRQVAYDAASEVLVTLAVDGEMRTWEMHGYALVQVIRSPGPLECIWSAIFNPTQECLVTANRRLQIWQHPRKTATAEVLSASLLAPKGHRDPLVAALYSHQFFLLVSGDESGRICVWDIKAGRQNFSFEHGSRLTTMTLDDSGRKLITGGANGAITMWNFSSGEKLRTISTDEAPRTEVTALLHVHMVKLCYHVSVGWHHDVWMWPDRDKAHPRRLGGHSDDILCVAYVPPNLLVSGAYDGTLIVHNIESGAVSRRVAPRRPHEGGGDPRFSSISSSRRLSHEDPFLYSCAIEAISVLDPERRLLPDCSLVCGSADGFLRIYSSGAMRLLEEVRVCDSFSDGVQHLCTEDSSTFVITGDTTGRIKVFDISELPNLWPTSKELSTTWGENSFLQTRLAKVLYSWRAHTHALTHVEYCAGIEGLVTASSDCTLRLWTLVGEQVGIFGQPEPWHLVQRSTWFDASNYVLEGSGRDDDKVAASAKRLAKLVPQRPSSRAAQRGQHLSAMAPPSKARPLYRVQPSQLEKIENQVKFLAKGPAPPKQLPPSNGSLVPLPPVASMVPGAAAASQGALPPLRSSGSASSSAAVFRAGTLWSTGLMPQSQSQPNLNNMQLGKSASNTRLAPSNAQMGGTMQSRRGIRLLRAPVA
jgi:WD40 repeat protein/Ca2+-binding EF-hand superfamily protein